MLISFADFQEMQEKSLYKYKTTKTEKFDNRERVHFEFEIGQHKFEGNVPILDSLGTGEQVIECFRSKKPR